MSNFNVFQKSVHDQLERMMIQSGGRLFVADINPYVLTEKYISFFRPEDNPVCTHVNKFGINRTKHDCNMCFQFIRRVGAIVRITPEFAIETIWDAFVNDPVYNYVSKAMSEYIKSLPIKSIFLSEFEYHGNKSNIDVFAVKNEKGEVIGKDTREWTHFYTKLHPQFIHNGKKESVDAVIGKYNNAYIALGNSLREISLNAIDIVQELLDANRVPRGEEKQWIINEFKKLKEQEVTLNDQQKELFVWLNCSRRNKDNILVPNVEIAAFRNSAIGTFIVDLTQGRDLNEAANAYGVKVSGPNYQQPKNGYYTAADEKKAFDFLIEYGLQNSLAHRHASLSDINITNVLWVGQETQQRLLGDNDQLAALLKKGVAKLSMKEGVQFQGVREISITEFIEKIIPHIHSSEVLFEDKHVPNLCSLLAPVHKNVPSLFKWNNNFGWCYKDNLADVAIRDLVVEYGGKSDVPVRITLIWNKDGRCNDDLDLHVFEGDRGFYNRRDDKNHIFFNNAEDRYNAFRHLSTGMLDIDIREPKTDNRTKERKGLSLENIRYADVRKMNENTYDIWVNLFERRTGYNEFEIELEILGDMYYFSHSEIKEHGFDKKEAWIHVARIVKESNTKFTVQGYIPMRKLSKEVWNLITGQFYPVVAVMFSPNFCDGQSEIGNRHYIMPLKGCLNPDSMNSFFNEQLRSDMREHRKVFNVLGKMMQVEYSDQQLSGLGFSSTLRHDITMKTDGSIKQVFKLMF